MSNDTTNDEQSQRGGQASNRDENRERMAWGLFLLLVFYVLLHPFMPGFTPDPGVVGAITTAMVSLLVARVFGGGGA